MSEPKVKRCEKAMVVPRINGPDVSWSVRIVVVGMRFWLDHSINYSSREEAQKVADRWNKRKVSVTVADARGGRDA